MTLQNQIEVKTLVKAPLNMVWNCWTDPKHIVKWNHASEDWHTTKAESNLVDGGIFSYRMEAKDGSFGFDFEGVFTHVVTEKLIAINLGDNRKMQVQFEPQDQFTLVKELFEPEKENPIAMQKTGWLAILDNFKTYVESL